MAASDYHGGVFHPGSPPGRQGLRAGSGLAAKRPAASPQGARPGGGSACQGDARGRRAPAQVGQLVSDLIKSAGLGDRSPLGQLRRVWVEAVGAEYAGQTRLVALRKGVLFVECGSAPLAHELSVYYKARLLDRLREQARVPLVDLRCRVAAETDPSG